MEIVNNFKMRRLIRINDIKDMQYGFKLTKEAAQNLLKIYI